MHGTAMEAAAGSGNPSCFNNTLAHAALLERWAATGAALPLFEPLPPSCSPAAAAAAAAPVAGAAGCRFQSAAPRLVKAASAGPRAELRDALAHGRALLEHLRGEKADFEAEAERVGQRMRSLEACHKEHVCCERARLEELQLREARALARYQAFVAEAAKLGDAEEALTSRQAELTAAACAAEAVLARGDRDCTLVLQFASQAVQAVSELEGYAERLAGVALNLERQRRNVFNQYQKLRGNLRVFCRVRPLFREEAAAGFAGSCGNLRISADETTIAVTPHLQQQTCGDLEFVAGFPSGSASGRASASASGSGAVATHRGAKPRPPGPGGNQALASKKAIFTFDRIFGPEATQTQVFDDVGTLVQSALDGFNVAIIAYGQTGSGKTYTMEGALGHEGAVTAASGIIPRAAKLIFGQLNETSKNGAIKKGAAQTTMRSTQGCSGPCTAQLSVLEVYNDTIRDLLCANDAPGKSGLSSAPASSASSTCEIRFDPRGNVIVTNLTKLNVDSATDVLRALQIASQQRSVASTLCNASSSRSHAIVQLRLTADASKPSSTLSFVDLAGSERVEKSQATGERFREAQAINKSLSCLADVVAAVHARRPFVPFRNSKLTLLLKDTFSDCAKTLILVNVSPSVNDQNETFHSLRFAAKAQQTSC